MKLIQTIKLLAFLIPLGAFSQQVVTGTVTDAGTGTPIPGVNVVIKGTTEGTSTDFDGNFQMEAENGTVLQFSYIGFTTQEVAGSGTRLNVTSQGDADELEEVVAIGEGSVSQKDGTGAVDQVTSEDFNKGPTVSAQQLIQGKVARVSISSGGGAPGEGQNIVIRGQGSLSLSSNPLYVVDGISLAEIGRASCREGV